MATTTNLVNASAHKLYEFLRSNGATKHRSHEAAQAVINLFSLGQPQTAFKLNSVLATPLTIEEGIKVFGTIEQLSGIRLDSETEIKLTGSSILSAIKQWAINKAASDVPDKPQEAIAYEVLLNQGNIPMRKSRQILINRID
jgi:hypothetical protein